MVDSMTPACTAATTSSPGWRSASCAHRSRRPARRTRSSSHRPGRSACRGRCPTRAPRSARPPPASPGRRPRPGGARTGRHSCTISSSRRPPTPGGGAPPSRPPGADPRRRGPRRLPAPRSRSSRAARAATWRRPRSVSPVHPRRPPTMPLTLHTASPCRTSTIRVAPAVGAKTRRTPLGTPKDSPRASGSPSLMPGCRRSAPVGAASGTRPPRRSGPRTPRPRSRPSPSSGAVRG